MRCGVDSWRVGANGSDCQEFDPESYVPASCGAGGTLQRRGAGSAWRASASVQSGHRDFFFTATGGARGGGVRPRAVRLIGLHGNVGAAASRLGAGGGVRGDGGGSRSSSHTAGVGRLLASSVACGCGLHTYVVMAARRLGAGGSVGATASADGGDSGAVPGLRGGRAVVCGCGLHDNVVAAARRHGAGGGVRGDGGGSRPSSHAAGVGRLPASSRGGAAAWLLFV